MSRSYGPSQTSPTHRRVDHQTSLNVSNVMGGESRYRMRAGPMPTGTVDVDE